VSCCIQAPCTQIVFLPNITRKAHGTNSEQSISAYVSLLSLSEIITAAWSLPCSMLLHTFCLEELQWNPGLSHHIRKYLQFPMLFQKSSKKLGSCLFVSESQKLSALCRWPTLLIQRLSPVSRSRVSHGFVLLRIMYSQASSLPLIGCSSPLSPVAGQSSS